MTPRPFCPDVKVTERGRARCVPERGAGSARTTADGGRVATYVCARCGKAFQDEWSPAEHVGYLRQYIDLLELRTAKWDEIISERGEARAALADAREQIDRLLFHVDEMENGSYVEHLIVGGA